MPVSPTTWHAPRELFSPGTEALDAEYILARSHSRVMTPILVIYIYSISSYNIMDLEAFDSNLVEHFFFLS